MIIDTKNYLECDLSPKDVWFVFLLYGRLYSLILNMSPETMHVIHCFSPCNIRYYVHSYLVLHKKGYHCCFLDYKQVALLSPPPYILTVRLPCVVSTGVFGHIAPTATLFPTSYTYACQYGQLFLQGALFGVNGAQSAL